MAKRGTKRPDTPAGHRFKEWLEQTYGSLESAATYYNQDKSAFTPYFKGDSDLGRVWKTRIIEAGGDYDFILTGRVQEIKVTIYREKLADVFLPDITVDEVRTDIRPVDGGVRVDVFSIKELPAITSTDFNKQATPKSAFRQLEDDVAIIATRRNMNNPTIVPKAAATPLQNNKSED